MTVSVAPTEEECYLYAIMSDISGIDIAEFLMTDETKKDYCWRAWPFQWPWLRCEDGRQIEQGSRSIGKALDINTPILTIDGWKTMETVEVGDQVFNEVGEPVSVTDVFEIMEDRPCYELSFNDGHTIVADADHLWTVRTRLDKKKYRSIHPTECPPHVTTTKDMVGSVLGSGGDPNYRINVAAALDCEEKELPIDPYLLGYWLGDGTSRSGQLTIGDQDIEAVSQIFQDRGILLENYPGRGQEIQYKVLLVAQQFIDVPPIGDPEDLGPGKSKHTNAQVHEARTLKKEGKSLSEIATMLNATKSDVSSWVRGKTRLAAGGPIQTRHHDLLKDKLKTLNLIQNKHIPEIYKRGSIDQRLALLRGLMDSDGSAGKHQSMCELTFVSRLLLADCWEIVVSLGERPGRQHERKVTCNGKPAGVAYRFTWTPQRFNPFSMPRKAERILPSRSSRISQRRITDIREVESRPVRCISVSGESRQFLVGPGLIPTHNSVSVKLRCLAFPFNYPGEEMMLGAPEGVHLDLLTDKVETVFLDNRFPNEMLAKGRRGGITHRPFQISFGNASSIFGRIPQRDGRGFKGTHPMVLEIDEAQDIPHKAWMELIETLKREELDAEEGEEARGRWRNHGVTRGVRDDFFKFTQPDSGWTVHRLPAMYRPTWTDEERAEKIVEYGSKDSPDYRRNILGLHGDPTSPLFVLARLMQCVDMKKDSDYNLHEYRLLDIDDGAIEQAGSIYPLLDIPASHAKYENVWIGLDVGFTLAPSAFTVFAEEKTTNSKPSALRLITRILLTRVSHEDQVRTILHLMEMYRPLGFAMDRTGLGLPLYQDIQYRVKNDPSLASVLDRIKGYNFSEKIVVDFDDSMERDETDPDDLKTREIRANVLVYSSDVLRGMVDDKRIILPWDQDLIAEFQGQTWSYASPTTGGSNKRKIYNAGSFHSLDAARMAALVHRQHLVDSILKNQETRWEPPESVFLY